MIRNVKDDCARRSLCCVLADKLPVPQSANEAQEWNAIPDPGNPGWCDDVDADGKNVGWDDKFCRKKVISSELITVTGMSATGVVQTNTYDLIIRKGPAKNYFNLMAMRELCQSICRYDQFQPDFRPNMKLGVWRLRPDKCPNDCSGRGVCEFSHCVCEP